jgi:hypothetical protein
MVMAVNGMVVPCVSLVLNALGAVRSTCTQFQKLRRYDCVA